MGWFKNGFMYRVKPNVIFILWCSIILNKYKILNGICDTRWIPLFPDGLFMSRHVGRILDKMVRICNDVHVCNTCILSIYIFDMMTSSNGNIFRVTSPLCREFTGHRWIPLTKDTDAELWCFLWSVAWTNGWVNNRDAGDLRRHRAHYDVTVMK